MRILIIERMMRILVTTSGSDSVFGFGFSEQNSPIKYHTCARAFARRETGARAEREEVAFVFVEESLV